MSITVLEAESKYWAPKVKPNLYLKVQLLQTMSSSKTTSESTTNVPSTPPTYSGVRRSSSLHFPRPHQLGISSGIYPSRSSKGDSSSFFQHHSSDDGIFQTPKVPIPTDSNLLVSTGIDETDAASMGPPPLKKAAIVGRPSKGRMLKAKKPKPIVKTYDEKPLKEFTLFLPPNLPKLIMASRSALQDFVKTTSTTYLSLWELENKMQVLELRFPPAYIELSEDGCFLKELLCSVFEQIAHVKSIEEVYLPKISLHPLAKLDDILEILSNTKCSIAHLFIPIKCSLQSSELEVFEYKTIAHFFHKTKIREVTFVSTDEVVQEFSDKLSVALKHIKKCAIKVNFSNEDLGAPGPNYITDLDQKPVVGEEIDPNLLVSSLNTTGVPYDDMKRNTGRECLTSRHKMKAHGAFSTDCTYTDEAELSSDGPFTSEVWNLDQLHENGIDGRGTTIAVIDSGINYTHPVFKGKIIAVKNFVAEEIDNVDCAIDSDGHGTHCAGIAAGNSFYAPLNSSNPRSPCIRVPPGVAPGAHLIICKVVRTTNGDVDSAAFFDALYWLKEQHMSGKQRIDVISISLASTYHSHERAQVICDLTSLGVIVVCCASNVGRLRMQPIAFPARLGHVLCIGAHDENGKPTSFSPVGRELDFLSPGDSLWGPGPGTLGPFAMDCASGTSCATPAVAGLVSLVLQAVSLICESDPKQYKIGEKLLIDHVRNVWVMREILKEMSSSPGHHSDEIGYGTLNPYRFLDRSHEEIMRIINEIIEDE